jgi:membrane-bound serine protease (ClpP class)
VNIVTVLQHSPNAAVLLFTAGLLLIYFELNRPGLIISGCAGLILALSAVAAFFHMSVSPKGAASLVSAFLLLAWSLRRGKPMLLGFVAGAGIFVGSYLLVDGPGTLHVKPWAAAITGVLLGPGTSVLTGIARRARVNKGLD